jgi:hypothetical protein
LAPPGACTFLEKGTHYGVNPLWMMVRKVSRDFTCPCWALKSDIRNLYGSIDHSVLLGLTEDESPMRV